MVACMQRYHNACLLWKRNIIPYVNRSTTRRAIVVFILVFGSISGLIFLKKDYSIKDRKPERVRPQSTIVCPVLQFAREALPVTALVSFPGSGNTWMRHLIQQLTGIYTGSVYHDPSLRQKGFRGEGKRNGSVVAIKTHRTVNTPEQPKYIRAILVVRNPYDALISEFNRRKSQNSSHVGSAPPAMFRSYVWTKFIKHSIKGWHRVNLSWLRQFRGRLHVIFYEDLKKNLALELNGVVDFLGVSPSFVKCALQRPKGNFLRRKTEPNYSELFGDEFATIAKEKIREVREAAYSASHVTMSGMGRSRTSINDYISLSERLLEKGII